MSLSTCGLLGFRLVAGGLFPCQRGVGLGLEVLDLGLHGFEPGLGVDVGGVLLGELVHRGVLAAHGLVGEVDGVREAAAVVGAEEQGEVGGHAAGLVGLGGDLPDQLLGVGNLLLVRLELLGDLGLVLLRQVHAGGEGLGFLDRTGHAALGVQQGLLRTGELALVKDQVRRRPGRSGSPRIPGNAGPGPPRSRRAACWSSRSSANATGVEAPMLAARTSARVALTMRLRRPATRSRAGPGFGAGRCIGVMGIPFSLRTLDPQVSTEGQE